MKDIHALTPRLPILAVTMHAEDQYAVRAFRAGAAGHITKCSSPAELVAAARKVADGGKYVSSSAGEALAKSLHSRSEASGHTALSDRELQALRMLGGGKTVTEIGAELRAECEDGQHLPRADPREVGDAHDGAARSLLRRIELTLLSPRDGSTDRRRSVL